ncbi:hypothetical protein B0H16DRAFT_1515213 [Mycena metata]|uniref:Uncharacterized protein n=1 Tax=Mycena metata TaxID=1033252 RepID=A0AAD7JVI8_9AGAR|nr:hypothetical protein B0H16DRAFT_1515213 [Mycena metata]
MRLSLRCLRGEWACFELCFFFVGFLRAARCQLRFFWGWRSCALEMARDGDGESRKVAMPMAIRIPDGGGGDDDAGVSSHSKVRWAARRGVISLRARQRVVIWVLA